MLSNNKHLIVAIGGIRKYATIKRNTNQSEHFAEVCALVYSVWCMRRLLNVYYREYCTNFQIKLIDLETKIPYFSLSQSKQKELWDDGVHFTAKGYDLFGEIIFEAIKDDL